MKALKWGWSEGLRVQLRPLANWKREEPVDEAKPFKIPKREVWEAFQRVKANQGAAGGDRKSGLEGKKVELGGRRIIKKKKKDEVAGGDAGNRIGGAVHGRDGPGGAI